MDRRFKSDLYRPGSFSTVDLGTLLERWAEALQNVRAPFQPNFLGRVVEQINMDVHDTNISEISGSNPLWLNELRSARLLESNVNFASAIDFDTAFAVMPTSNGNGSASYWVHNDNIVELQVQLLQYMRLFPHTTSKSPIPRSSSFQSQRKPTTTSEHQSLFDGHEDLNLVIFDDPKHIVEEQNKDNSSVNKHPLVRFSARYNNCNEAIILLQPTSDFGNDGLASSKLKIKNFNSLLDISKPFPQSSSGSNTPTHEANGIENSSIHVIRQWIERHADIEPLVGICCQRMRFTSLNQASTQSSWAILDRNVSMTSLKPEDLSNMNRMSNLRSDSRPFPHALLQVRQTGTDAEVLLEKLDQSHLVERVHGFSIEEHAVWECCKPPDMKPPPWIPKLSQEIRRVPSNDNALSRRSSTSLRLANSAMKTPKSTPSISGPEPGESSDTAVSVPKAGPSIASARLKKAIAIASRKQKRKLSIRSQTAAENLPKQGYWNEYDEPEDDNDNAYVIWVNPGSSLSFKEWLSSLLPSWLRPSSADPKPLLSPDNSNIEESLLDDSSSTSDESVVDQDKPKSYGTINPLKSHHLTHFLQPRGITRHTALPRSRFPHTSSLPDLESQPSSTERSEHRIRTLFTLLTFSASLAIFVVICVLAATGRHKQVYQVDAGIVFGIVVNLLFACVGLGCLVSGRKRTGWLGWCCGVTVFGAICVGNGGLCAWLVT